MVGIATKINNDAQTTNVKFTASSDVSTQATANKNDNGGSNDTSYGGDLIIDTASYGPTTSRKWKMEDNSDDDTDDDEDTGDDYDEYVHAYSVNEKENKENNFGLLGQHHANNNALTKQSTYRRFHYDTDTTNRILEGKCGFTRKLCEDICNVKIQHNGLATSHRERKKQCVECNSIIHVIMNSELPNGYRQIPNVETLAFGYVIYGEKNVVEEELFPIENKYTSIESNHDSVE